MPWLADVDRRQRQRANTQPLLVLRVEPNQTGTLVLSGHPGAHYPIQKKSSLLRGVSWEPWTNMTLVNSAEELRRVRQGQPRHLSVRAGQQGGRPSILTTLTSMNQMKTTDCPPSDFSRSRHFACKPDFDECMARIEAWYEQRIVDRPPVRFHHHNVEYERHRTVTGPWKTPEERWLDVEFQVNTFLRSLEGAEFLGETFPVFWPNLSAVVYNLFLGQPAEFDDVTAWTHPWVVDLDAPPPLAVQWEGKYFQAVEALTRRALERAEGRFLVGYTDMYAGIDCTAGLRGAEAMCLDMGERPKQLRELIERVFREYPAVYEHFDRCLKQHGQLSVTWMNLPSYETFNVLACDFAVNISPRHFDEFCLPIIRHEASLYRHNVFHMDGPGVAKHIDSVLTLPNLVAVQWVQGYGVHAPILQWVPLIRKIQQAGKSVIVDLSVDELEAFMKQVDRVGIMLWINAAPNDQRDILRRVARW